MTSEEIINTLTQQNKKQEDTINRLLQIIEELKQTIKELNEKLSRNSRNSSKPPSSDGLSKASPKSLRKPSGKKAGGQIGHPGTNLSIKTEPDEVIQHMPLNCHNCPLKIKCNKNSSIVETRNVIDAVIDVKKIAHQTLAIICPLHKIKYKGVFPKNIKAPVQYGENLEALAVSLNTIGAVSVNRTHKILSSVFNIPLSTGTINTMVSRCAAGLDGIVEHIRERISASRIAHFDETGTRVEGNTMWVHNASNKEYTHLTVHEKRGTIGMDSGGVLPMFRGVAVHDCWMSYWKYDDIDHAICCAHILRELIGVEENHPEQKWATSFKEMLLDMKVAKEKALKKGEALSRYYLEKYDRLYDRIITEAYRKNPLSKSTEKKRGRKKKGTVLSLIERLSAYKESICLFIKNPMVPFDNNQAERDIRMVKTKTKVSGCIRSKEGAMNYLKIMSYVGTATKQNVNPYESIRYAILDKPYAIFAN